MLTVYKYPIQPGESNILMPSGAEILSCHVQNGEPFVWAIVDTGATIDESRKFTVHGTGHELPDDIGKFNYLGTFLLEDGRLVFHVWYE